MTQPCRSFPNWILCFSFPLLYFHGSASPISNCQYGDHTGRSWQMTCHIEHIILILSRLGNGKVGGTPGRDGGVADAPTIMRLKMSSRLCTTAWAPKVIKTKSEEIRGGVVGAVAAVMATGPNRTVAQVEIQEVAQPMKDFLNWEEWGGKWCLT